MKIEFWLSYEFCGIVVKWKLMCLMSVYVRAVQFRGWPHHFAKTKLDSLSFIFNYVFCSSWNGLGLHPHYIFFTCTQSPKPTHNTNTHTYIYIYARTKQFPNLSIRKQQNAKFRKPICNLMFGTLCQRMQNAASLDGCAFVTAKIIKLQIERMQRKCVVQNGIYSHSTSLRSTKACRRLGC